VVRDLLEHASAAFDEGAYKEASDYYRAALKLAPSRETACNLGVAARLSGNITEAAQALTECLAEPLPPLAPGDEDERARRARLRGDLEVVRQQTGTIEVTTTPGAEVLIDDLPRGAAPLSAIFVLPGTHSVAVRDARGTARGLVAVGAGKSVSIALEPKAPIVAPKAQPPAPIPMPPPPANSGATRPLVVVGSVVTVLAFGTGLVTLTAAQIINHQTSGEDEPPAGDIPEVCADGYPGQPCDEIRELRRAGRTLQTVSLASFAVMGVVGGGTLIYALSTAPAQGPVASVNASGITLGWRGTW
jgi:hypothetical protein